MAHTVTAKLNKSARKFDNQAGSTFFLSLGETNKWTNYDAALFAKDGQISFYEGALVEGAIVTVSGSGIIVDDSNKDYPPKLIMQDAKLNFISDGQSSAPAQRQQAPAAGGSGGGVDDGFQDIPFGPIDFRAY